MVKYLNKAFKSFIHSLGFDVHRLSPRVNASLQICRALNAFDIDMLFDIGANSGQFVGRLRSMGYEGNIVSFEPLCAAHKAMTIQASRDPKWTVHPRTAIGDFDGEIDINISSNSVSSSILPMLSIHEKMASESVYIGQEKVAISRLDSIAPIYIYGKENLFIKIDTQGFEWQVLDGAKETLSKCRGILCELSLLPLYENQRLWLEIIERLNSDGFTLWAVQGGFMDSKTGQTLQVDAMFFRLD